MGDFNADGDPDLAATCSNGDRGEGAVFLNEKQRAASASRSGSERERGLELAGNRHPNVGWSYWAPARGEGILLASSTSETREEATLCMDPR